jgi:zinc protease
MKQVCLSLWVFLALVRGPVSAEAGMTAKRTVLNNGMVLLTSEQRALPMVSIELLIETGSRYEPADQAGLANLTSKLLIYGTKQRTAVQISDTLDFIGTSLEAGCGQDTTSVSMTVL